MVKIGYLCHWPFHFNTPGVPGQHGRFEKSLFSYISRAFPAAVAKKKGLKKVEGEMAGQWDPGTWQARMSLREG